MLIISDVDLQKMFEFLQACQFSQDKSDSHIIGTQDSATFSTVGSDVLLTYSAEEAGTLRSEIYNCFYGYKKIA